MKIQFGSGSYKLGESAHFSAQRMVNAYLEASPPGSESPYYVRERYGIATDRTVGTLHRGACVVRGVLYVVSGTKAYRVPPAGAAVELGTVPGTGRVMVKGDETNVAFLADRRWYVWNGSTFAEVSDPDAPASDWADYLDGYYIGSDHGTGQFFISDNRDPTSWSPLEFASAEKYPDDVVTGIVDHSELLLFGTESGQGYYNSGNADFPFEPVISATWEVGIASVHARAKFDNSVAFVGADFVVYRLNGYQPVRISSHSVEVRLRNATDKDFVCHSWQEAGHPFLSVGNSEFTFVFDGATQLWHERESYGYAYWLPQFVVPAYNKLYVGDSLSGRLGVLTGDVATDWDGVMRSSATCPPVSDDNKRTIHSRLELVFEAGQGTYGSEAQVMLRWSDDRGRTWSNEHWRSLGSLGQYTKRAVWNRLGISRGRIYEWAISDGVRRTLIGATLETEAGGY